MPRGLWLKELLRLRSTHASDADDPQTTIEQRNIIREKRFLSKIYREWYRHVEAAIPAGPGKVLELGSGAGFLHECFTDVVTSDVLMLPHVQVIADAQKLPFAEGSLKAIVMINVLHHLPRPRQFFQEASRCVRTDGRLIMIEPWVTPWSRVIYRTLHHEPFLPESSTWEFDSEGPLSGANGALPWIVFGRDRARFEREFPMWEIQSIQPGMPFSYLISGGVSFRSFAPGAAYELVRILERIFTPWMNSVAMFANIVLNKGLGVSSRPK
jgi:SAM-dependent methyltransferase